MAEELKKKIKQRGAIKARLTRAENFLTLAANDPDSLQELQIRVENLTTAHAEFVKIQDEIDILTDDDQFDEVAEFEDKLFQVQAGYKKCIELFQADKSKPSHGEQSTPRESILHSSSFQQSDHALPKISIPKFNGKVSQWLSFSDSFSSLIHNNDGIDNVRKFHYLKNSLIEEAAGVIDSIPVTAANYETAWETLDKRYNNKKLIVNHHLQEIVSFKPMARESCQELRNLIDCFNKNMKSLSSLGIDTSTWDSILIFLLSSKVDPESKRLWEMTLTTNELPSFHDFTNFLETRCFSLSSNATPSNYNKKSISCTLLRESNKKCRVCEGLHKIHQCPTFLKLSPNERFRIIRDNKLCFKCFNYGHDLKRCNFFNCKKCQAPHNILLHFDKPKPDEKTELMSGHVTCLDQVILATAVVSIENNAEENISVRCFLDSGSQCNLITHKMATQLGLKLKRSNIHISGIHSSRTNANYVTECFISSRFTNFKKLLTCLVVPTITGNLPNTVIDKKNWNFLNDFELADNQFHVPHPVQVLIGADTIEEIYLNEAFNPGPHYPKLRKTRLGWIVIGTVKRSPTRTQCVSTCSSFIDLSKQLQKFWEIEENIASEEKKENIIVEDFFMSTYERLDSGRFEVSMPFIEGFHAGMLGDSLVVAQARFSQMERKMLVNSEFKGMYEAFMAEYEELNHMEKVSDSSDTTGCYYLPHHAVFKENSMSSKIRVVFNGSQKTSTKNSLNDLLLGGPTVQDDLFDILIRFRFHKVAFSSDIEKMYRQISLNPSQRDYLRILWRDRKDQAVGHYRLNTVTYGTKPAAFLATRCIRQLANDSKEKYPAAAKILERDCYVDNILSGSDNIETAKLLRDQLMEITKSACFPLRKWCSNNRQLTDGLHSSLIDENIDFSNPESYISTLGLSWHPSTDKFLFKFTMSTREITKRSLVSLVAGIFDPLGLLSPVTVRAKNLIQLSWLRSKNWDSTLDEEITGKWNDFQDQLNNVKEISIPRYIGSDPQEIHIFCDSSKMAYAACCYAVRIDENNERDAMLICSKTRVAPLKLLSIPRLELCGALLAAKLCKKLSDAYYLNQNLTFHLWTDSQIVLHWLNSPAREWKVFVANRVSQIQNILGSISHAWHHVPTKSNPADIASRGINIELLKNNDLWWRGPSWIITPSSNWPQTKIRSDDSYSEDLIICSNFTPQYNDLYELINKFSSLGKLMRTFVNMRRFINYCQKSSKLEFITASEYNASLQMLIKLHQSFWFQNELNDLKNQKTVSDSSKIIQLSPFLDEFGVLRVGGRLKHSNLNFDTKYPIILANNDNLTRLIIDSEHKRCFHAGPQLLRSILSQKFWILKSGSFVKKVIHNCLVCARLRKESITQLMGNLPSSRVTASPPFTRTGLDFGGPFFIKRFKGKCNKVEKCYLCLFVCFTTRAVHLELVSDLTSDAFLASLRRFIARRGKPRDIFCDNGRNFVGAKKILDNFRRFLTNKETVDSIFSYVASEGITWHLLPAYAPHLGGIWEAGIKSVKTHLQKVMAAQSLTFEEFYTILCEIETILNSRPLTTMSDDATDFEVLTPAHFLINRIPEALPEELLNDTTGAMRFKWNRVRFISQSFWKRWQSEFLTRLQSKSKWLHLKPNLTIGEMVLIKDENVHPLKWPLARVQNLHYGSDNLVRVVDLLTTNGIIRRSISKLVKLPIAIEQAAQSGEHEQ